MLGFALGALALYVQTVRSGPPLELWHTVELDAEFRADRLNEIEDFDDYLALEQQLFVQLDERVYAHTARGEDRAAHQVVVAPYLGAK